MKATPKKAKKHVHRIVPIGYDEWICIKANCTYFINAKQTQNILNHYERLKAKGKK